jgi:hypothetical protein
MRRDTCAEDVNRDADYCPYFIATCVMDNNAEDDAGDT